MLVKTGRLNSVSRAFVSSMTTDCRTQKQALRQQIKTVLSNVSEEHISAQSQAAQLRLTELEQYRKAKRISIYLSMPNGELRTDHLIRDALQNGKAVFVPYLSKERKVVPQQKPRKIMSMLRLASLEEYTRLTPDAWGIPTLPKDGIEERENALGRLGVSQDGTTASEAVGLDMIVVPGVAFDHEMRRLGHGAGFYDSYLTRYATDVSKQMPFLVGLCLAEQFLAPGVLVPTTEHDWNVDVVIAGDRGVHERLQ